jgi:hypothetical protein
VTSYWPTSAVMQYLDGYRRVEIANAQLHPITMLTMRACHTATSKIPACTSLAIVCSKGAGIRRVYLSHPNFEQWTALERGGFVEMWDDFGFVMDALH